MSGLVDREQAGRDYVDGHPDYGPCRLSFELLLSKRRDAEGFETKTCCKGAQKRSATSKTKNVTTMC